MSITRAQSLAMLVVLVAQSLLQSGVGEAIGWLLFVLAIILVCGLIFLVYAGAQYYLRRRDGAALLSDEVLLGQIARLNVQMEGIRAEHQKEIDALITKHAKEIAGLEEARGKLEKRVRDNMQLRKQLLGNKETEKKVTQPQVTARLLVAIGEDAALQLDEASLRAVQTKTGLNFRRVRHATLDMLKDHLERARLNKRPYRNVHLAVHSTPEGIFLGGQLITGLQLSEVFKGVDILLIAGCESSKVGDKLGVVKWVVTMVEEVPNDDASVFAQAFWTEIGLGNEPPQALQLALEAAPSGMDEMVEFHW